MIWSDMIMVWNLVSNSLAKWRCLTGWQLRITLVMKIRVPEKNTRQNGQRTRQIWVDEPNFLAGHRCSANLMWIYWEVHGILVGNLSANHIAAACTKVSQMCWYANPLWGSLKWSYGTNIKRIHWVIFEIWSETSLPIRSQMKGAAPSTKVGHMCPYTYHFWGSQRWSHSVNMKKLYQVVHYIMVKPLSQSDCSSECKIKSNWLVCQSLLSV